MNSLRVYWNPPKKPNGEILGYLVTYETAHQDESKFVPSFCASIHLYYYKYVFILCCVYNHVYYIMCLYYIIFIRFNVLYIFYK